ncbi:MAG: hypothetical protein ACK4ZX_09365, partial [Thermus sp.]
MPRVKRLSVLAVALLGLALGNANDSEIFTITVQGVESVNIDLGTASNTVDFHSSGGQCSVGDNFCAWYPFVIYSTNYSTNRKLVANATTSDPILSVILEKQGSPYDNPFVPSWGSGSNPGVWASGFSGSSLT